MIQRDELPELQLDNVDVSQPGVAELMELYGQMEAIYIAASASIMETDVVYTMDSTSLVTDYAALEPDFN